MPSPPTEAAPLEVLDELEAHFFSDPPPRDAGEPDLEELLRTAPDPVVVRQRTVGAARRRAFVPYVKLVVGACAILWLAAFAVGHAAASPPPRAETAARAIVSAHIAPAIRASAP